MSKNFHDATSGDLIGRNALKIRNLLMEKIRGHIDESGLSPEEAEQFFGATDSQVTDVVRGNIAQCSIEQLVGMLAAAGFTVDFKIDGDKKSSSIRHSAEL